MSKKRFVIPGLILALGLALLAYVVSHPTVTVTLTRDQVQQRVDAKLPLAGTRMGVAYEVSRATVDLRSDGRIGVDADVSATTFGRRADLALVGSGAIAYRDGEFFLTGFKLEKAVPKAVDPALGDEIRPKGRIGAVVEALALKDRAAKALEAAGVEDGAAFLTAGKEAVVATVRGKGESMLAGALERHPVYRLKEGDARQSLAKLALRDVRIEDGKLVADLNVLHAAVRVLLYGLVVVLAVAAGLAFLAALSGMGAGVAGVGLGLGLLD